MKVGISTYVTLAANVFFDVSVNKLLQPVRLFETLCLPCDGSVIYLLNLYSTDGHVQEIFSVYAYIYIYIYIRTMQMNTSMGRKTVINMWDTSCKSSSLNRWIPCHGIVWWTELIRRSKLMFKCTKLTNFPCICTETTAAIQRITYRAFLSKKTTEFCHDFCWMLLHTGFAIIILHGYRYLLDVG